MTIFTNTIKTAVLAVIMGIITTPAAYAIIAKPGVIQASQPDGTIVNIRLEGTFGNHRAYSTDGYLLTTDPEGFYVFADCSEDGMPVSSGIRVVNPENRDAATMAAISRLDQSRITDAFKLRNETATRNGNSPMRGPGLYSSHFPTKGEQHSIAILVNFADREFEMKDPKDFYYRMLNEEGFSDNGATGSARDYYIDNSYGQFQPVFDVYGPVTLSDSTAYYGANDKWGNDRFAHKMIIEACQLLDDKIDFSQYDRNGDGVIDNVYVFYAGYGEADGGKTTTIWPHSYDIEYAEPDTLYMLDSVRLNHYACSNELDFETKKPDGIGSFTHEFSHVMGLPDLYATDGSLAYTPGKWSILDVGSYNNHSHTPPNYSSFERYALDWMEPEIIDTPGEYSLEPLHLSNKAYMFPTEKSMEYFLFENRQKDGNDRYLPGHGMLVWHVQFNQRIWDENIVNNNVSHQYVDLVEADNKKTDKTQSGDPFPGKDNVTSFTAETNPAFLSWAKKSPGFDIFNIEESEEGVISFTVKAYESGIDTIPDNESGITIAGRSVSCAEGTATVYDLSGKPMATISSVPVTLNPGLYILSTSTSTRKLLIK